MAKRTTHFLCLTLLLWQTAWAAQSAPQARLHNQLQGHASPYLAMHAKDPVAWQTWSPATLALARKQDKLLFISSGYFACHWCHVMQRESFRNPAIARLLNRYFIPVKIDRELNPQLDNYLMNFQRRTGSPAGWPLNMFLTPEGYTLIGTTYLPPDRFEKMLRKLHQIWDKNRAKTRNLARETLLRLSANPPQSQTPVLDFQALRARFLRQALALGDPLEGGFGQQGRFPMSPQLLGLLALSGQRSNPAVDELLQTTLNQIASQGLRDHLGGGFFRYTIDPAWQMPHFEKMLYTQAQLARVFLEAGQRYHNKDYLQVARQTLDFVLDQMRNPRGLLIASLSAVDGKGEEGGVYLWTPEQLERLLGKQDAALAEAYWQLHGVQAQDTGYLPRPVSDPNQLAQRLHLSPAEMDKRLDKIRAKLLQARQQRELPRDHKVLAGWNGLMLGTLALAGAQLKDPRYTKAAVQLAHALRQTLWHDGELWRAASDGKSAGEAGLQDYAFVAQGVALLLRTHPDSALQTWLGQLLQVAWGRFFQPTGWMLGQQIRLPGMGDVALQKDGALLSATGVLIQTTLQAGSPAQRQLAMQALQLGRERLQKQPFWYPSQLRALQAASAATR